jgi:hypothetical protein
MSVGSRASERASRGGISAGVGADERVDFLRESHDGILEDEEVCCCWSSVVEGLAFFSASNRSMNFWISGSVFELDGADVEGSEVVVVVVVVDVTGGVSVTGAADLSSLEGVEDHNQPIATFYKW